MKKKTKGTVEAGISQRKSVYTSRFWTYNDFSSVLAESEGVELNEFYRANTRIN